MPKDIQIKLISHYHNDPLVGHFGIKKTCKLLAWKYFWFSLQHNVKAYIKGSDLWIYQ